MGYTKDQWTRPVRDAGGKQMVAGNGKPVRENNARFGKGKRWLACWADPDGNTKTKAFEKKSEADRHWRTQETDRARGVYVDPDSGREKFKDYAEEWLTQRPLDIVTRDAMSDRLRLHVYPVLGHRELRNIKPSTIRAWLGGLTMAASYRRLLFTNVSSILGAAVDDELIRKNPCHSKSIGKPTPSRRKVVPWPSDRVFAIRDGLQERYRVTVTMGAGLGLRQGEIFGLAVDDVDWLRGFVHVQRQVKLVRGALVYRPPKGNRTRTVPLPESVKLALAAHLEDFPTRDVTLPWGTPDGNPTTARLMVTNFKGNAVNRGEFNRGSWKPALVTAGVIRKPKPGERYQPSREHGMHALRHAYASMLLDAGESIKALSEYLGHSDPGFTLRVYAHMVAASSEDRTRKAIDAALVSSSAHGAETEQNGAEST